MRPAFPNQLARQILPPNAPPNMAHLQLASSSSQLAMSAMQAEFAVQFYGPFLDDAGMALEYMASKMRVVLEALIAAETPPSTVGLVAAVRISLDGEPVGRETADFVGTHLKTEIDPQSVQEASVRIALRVADTHFVSLSVATFQERGIQRAFMPGLPVIVDPWEGDVTDHGLEVTVDINNRLRAMTLKQHQPVAQDDLDAAWALLNRAATSVGPEFALTGSLSASAFDEDPS